MGCACGGSRCIVSHPAPAAMKRLLLLAAALLAAPGVDAQIRTGECQGPNPSVADDTNRMLAERHRGLLSRFYSVGTVGAGPAVGTGDLMQMAAFEGGYQFNNGDAFAVTSSVRTALLRDPVFGEINPETGQGVYVGFQYVAGLGRVAPSSALARRSELGVGLSTSDYGGGGVVAAELNPRVVLPLTAFLSVPVGVQISQPLSGYDGARTFVGLSLGLRTQYVPPSRRALDCDGFHGSGVPQR